MEKRKRKEKSLSHFLLCHFACPVFLFPSTETRCLPGLLRPGLTPFGSFLDGEGISDGIKLLLTKPEKLKY
jgi:hypothetical protein